MRRPEMALLDVDAVENLPSVIVTKGGKLQPEECMSGNKFIHQWIKFINPRLGFSPIRSGFLDLSNAADVAHPPSRKTYRLRGFRPYTTRLRPVSEKNVKKH